MKKKLKSIKRNVLSFIRYSIKCPNCKEELLLDEKVLAKYNDQISCYKCNTDYIIINVNKKKDLVLEVISKSKD